MKCAGPGLACRNTRRMQFREATRLRIRTGRARRGPRARARGRGPQPREPRVPGRGQPGARAARGAFLVLLNNDVVVTPGWLDRLVRCATAGPRPGLAGAVTNYAPPPVRRIRVHRPDRARRVRRGPGDRVRGPDPGGSAPDRVLPARAAPRVRARRTPRRGVRARVLRRRRPVPARAPGRVPAGRGPGLLRAPLREHHVPRPRGRHRETTGREPGPVPGQVGRRRGRQVRRAGRTVERPPWSRR
ncbi:Glycosyl transferase family 2 OS=Ammonifex degensii (strain DSM 10501 / KC4) GN=Adeg_1129 PE=4 SV=1 [Gemmata massiliana]|uniref:Glycosyl transferase family 2 n=1 Tax=Gemmata massiliana TaxID=1210884 RepID=A0A6P2CWF4_9BACT|nr:Glycosyl transferase family 2 OS=Ammonifex degensii (strain DSM 10501 / KC4) GN=Adeg_1129 PE=4 SV=1 [Gemmata massiliana]